MLTTIQRNDSYLIAETDCSPEKLLEILEYQKARKLDMVVGANQIKIIDGKVLVTGVPTNQAILMKEQLGAGDGTEDFTLDLHEIAKYQLATKFGMPRKYVDTIFQEGNPKLYDRNINSWLAHLWFSESKKSKKICIRAFRNEVGGTEGIMRACVSSRYKFIDNLDMLTIALDTVNKVKEDRGIDIEVAECSISPNNMYVRFVAPQIEAKTVALKEYRNPKSFIKDEGVATGFVISNSEVGRGGFKVSPRLVVNACKNGMVWTDESYKKTHIGSEMSMGIIAWSDRTVAQHVRTMQFEVKDIIERFCSKDWLGKKVAEIEKAAAQQLEHPQATLNNIAEHLRLSDKKRESLFNSFMRQGATSNHFDVVQALTWEAQDLKPDQRLEMEQAATALMPKIGRFDYVKK